MIAGERQVAPTRDGIRRDHVARYEWAARLLQAGQVEVLDVACGIGYGTQLLAQAGIRVLGMDRDAEAIAYAKEHYSHELAGFVAEDASNAHYAGDFGAVVCFETIEHLEDPLPMLKALSACAPLLYASVPNEDVFPWKGYAFHYRHYTQAQFQDLLARAGWRVISWYGQAGKESDVEAGVQGRTLIAIAVRADPGATGSLKVPAPEKVPEHVAIVGLGPTCVSFFELARRLGGVSAYCDEVWGINAMGDVLRCDRVFHMDDVRIQEARAEARPASNIAAMLKWLRRHPGPVYTSVVREGYPGLVAFPLQDVLNGRYDTNGGAPYFNSTVAYAIAYAVHIGVKRISLYGVDYTLANVHAGEKGRACCEFWLGIAAARGIEISVPDTSPLLDGCEPEELRLYGYDCVDVTLHDRPEGGVEVHFKARDKIPSAAEIEARYDHKQHPNRLVREAEQKKE